MYRADEHVSEDDIFNIYYHENARKDKIPPYKFDAFINSCSVTFEIDTGASITIISEETMNLVKRKSAVNVVSASSKIRTYSGELIKLLGQIQATLAYHGNELDHLFTVIKGNQPNLLGRDLLND